MFIVQYCKDHQNTQSGMLDAARSYGFKVPEESQLKSSLEAVFDTLIIGKTKRMIYPMKLMVL